MTRPAFLMGGIVAVMWILELIDSLTDHSLDSLGIAPRTPASLPEIFTAPLLHFGWGHLISNTVPLFILGFLVLSSGIRTFLLVSATTVVSSGLLVWLISPSNSLTLGASGVVFGYLAYLLIRGFYTKSWWQLLIAAFVGMTFGGILWGVLPSSYGISWQAHLGGALGGLLAARLLHRRPTTAP